VRVHDEPADLGFLEEFFDAGNVGAFGSQMPRGSQPKH